MRSENLNLKKILDLDKWQKLQDSLALVTKMAIITVDYKGIPVTNHSYCTHFCEKVRKDPELAAYCRKCDARGGLEAVRHNEPYIYLCYCNIVDVAIPIIIDNQYIGAIMAGQVKLKESKNERTLEQIASYTGDLKQKSREKKLNKDFSELPSLTLTEVENTAKMLSQLCNYIVEEALNKSLMFEIYEESIYTGKGPDLATTLASYKSQNIEAVQAEISNVLTDKQIKKMTNNQFEEFNEILHPALNYMIKHKDENMSLNEAAELCNLSPGYFSRLFKKETGKNFTTYNTILKVEWAKELLETTNLTVVQISEELGYRESGYFIKKFKVLEGITPHVYRKYQRGLINN